MFKVAFLICFFSQFTFQAASALEIPRLTAPVIDKAGMISRKTENELNRVLQSLYQQGGSQIAVLTLPSLEGETIESASIQIVDQWKLGDEKKDNGLLLLIAKEERQIRIEVGQGLEGDIPDIIAKRIIDQSMTPLFRSGDMDSGIMVGVYQIVQKAHPDIQLNWEERSSPRRKGSPLAMLIFIIIIIVVGIRHPFLALFLLSGMSRRGGSYGGGFSGGGGFGGGGGGFSGGGASGGW